MSTALLLVFILALQFVSDAFRHWFVLPLAMCGALAGADALDWLRGRADVFDPVGILGLLGVHFLLAPLLHVYWDTWMQLYGRSLPPPDWRPWLGAMAVLNLFGLLVYRATRDHRVPVRARIVSARVWRLNGRAFPVVLGLALAITLVLQLWVYRQYGGLLGYIRSYEAREGAFTGMGWIFMISESFPILAFMGYAVVARRRRWARAWPAVVLALVTFFGLQILFGGLRGSRSNTIWGLFWAVGIIHVWVRPVGRKMVFAGLTFLLLFMYAYGFYKGGGLGGLVAARDPSQRAQVQAATGRTLQTVLLGDLARADVQAFLLYRLSAVRGYDYGLGRTYLGGAAILVPRSLWPDRPPTKILEGTEAQFGRGSWVPGVWSSSRVYGLAGEAMLNFGPVAIPFAFAALGLIVAWVRRQKALWGPGDTRRLLLPLLVNLCLVMLVGDSDNVVFFLVNNGLVPFVVVLCSSTVARRRPMARGPLAGSFSEQPVRRDGSAVGVSG